MRMKLSWNMAVQVVATLVQVFNGYGAILPAKYQALGAGLFGGLQLIVAAAAHYSNPDGSPAALPYVATTDAPKTISPGLKVFVLLIGLSAMIGCAHSVGYAGKHPGVVQCKGKGSITGTGTIAGAGGLGAAGTNSFSITADCGSGLELRQGDPKDIVPLTPAP